MSSLEQLPDTEYAEIRAELKRDYATAGGVGPDPLLARLDAYADRLREELRVASESRDVVVERFGAFKRTHWKQVEALRASCEQAEARVRELEAAVKWVLNDANYKAPEQIGTVARRWIAPLHRALAAGKAGGA